MFADLLAEEIQPGEIGVEHIPDIELSESLRNELQNALKEEEGKFVKVSNKTAVVQTDKNYVFFSNQWLYLAVLCKRYAEELKPYGDFFDTRIRGNENIMKVLKEEKYSEQDWIQLIPDQTDRERMIKFIKPDNAFRPGKALLNDGKPRSIKDIFGSCILKKMAVPDVSSAYLGNLVYCLVKRPDLYNKLEAEVRSQIESADGARKLSKVAKDCAKQIIDCIYDIDRFGKIKLLFEINEKNIKVDISRTGDLLPEGNYLRYIFARPSSDYIQGNQINREFLVIKNIVFL